MAVASNGEPCLPWKDVIGASFFGNKLPDNLDGTSNYCRNPDDDDGGAWCVVKGEDGDPLNVHGDPVRWKYCTCSKLTKIPNI